MQKKTRWITEVALMLALLIVLQWVTKPAGQLVTGSCVNAVLAVSVLMIGIGGGITVALLSPVFAYLLGVAPNLVTVPAIMIGNAVFVALLYLICGSGASLGRSIAAWLTAAVSKFAVLYVLVVTLICGVAADALLAKGLLMPPMLKVLPTMFLWPQLITALVGGAIALLITPVLRKALHRN